ncbi:MAG TPA: AMP-binding protein [Terriglobales bacterium]|jgi:crotonobetaine/carnitine-CoA ligase|nr:AMP-binding protein [Terriglobales bacterium]
MKYISPVTLRELLANGAMRHPDRIALIFQGQRWTYGDFWRAANRIANGLSEMGIKRGDRVALVLPNSSEFLLAVFAITAIGAVFVPVNPVYTAEEAEYVLHHSGAIFCVTSLQLLPLIDSVRKKAPALKEVIVVGNDAAKGAIPWSRIMNSGTEIPPDIALDPEDLASITYTSGTTDRPKGVMLSQYAYAFAPRVRAQGLGWNSSDRVLCLLPLFHVNALCHMCIGMLSVGGAIVLTEKFSASRFWDEVREHGVTTSSLMRTIPQILLALPEKADDRDNPLRLVVALLSPEMHVRFEERFDVRAVPSYSLTEDILSIIGPGEMPRTKLGSCGLPLAPELHRIRIVDEAGNSLPPGKAGEIVKQSPTVMQGYYRNPEATSKALRDGWLYTGDLGYLDEDGYLYFVDRLKDMVRRGDENISSEEVERVLNSHPQIAESAVVAVADAIRGEEVKAYIVLKSSATRETVAAEEIWNFCQQHLAAFKVPRYIEYISELPKTPSSKVQKNILRDQHERSGATVYDRLARGNS